MADLTERFDSLEAAKAAGQAYRNRSVVGRLRARRDANEGPIIRELERCGWLVQQLNIEDWPDLICFKAGRIVLVQVKNPDNRGATGKESGGQREVRLQLERKGTTIHLAKTLGALLRSLGEIE